VERPDGHVRRRPLAPRTADQGRGAGRQRLRMDHRHVAASDLLLDVPHHPRGEQVHREYRHGAERQADRQGRPDRTSLFRAGVRPLHPLPDLRRHALPRQGARSRRRMGHDAPLGLGDLHALRRGPRPRLRLSPRRRESAPRRGPRLGRPPHQQRHGLSERRRRQGAESPLPALRGQRTEQPARPERLGGCRRSLRRSHPHRRRVRLRPGSGKRVVQQLLGRRLHQRTHLGLELRKRQLLPDGCLVGGLRLSAGEFLQIQRRVPDAELCRSFRDRLGRPAGDRGRASGGDRPGTLRRTGPLLEPRPASGSDGRPRRQRRVDVSDRDQHPLRPLDGNLSDDSDQQPVAPVRNRMGLDGQQIHGIFEYGLLHKQVVERRLRIGHRIEDRAHRPADPHGGALPQLRRSRERGIRTAGHGRRWRP